DAKATEAFSNDVFGSTRSFVKFLHSLSDSRTTLVDHIHITITLIESRYRKMPSARKIPAKITITTRKADYFGGFHLENPALASSIINNPFGRLRRLANSAAYSVLQPVVHLLLFALQPS